MSSQLTVYKASAGSGKTFTLAREYMTLVIANPCLLYTSQDKSWYYRCRNCRHRHARRFAAGRRLFDKQKVINNIIYF